MRLLLHRFMAVALAVIAFCAHASADDWDVEYVKVLFDGRRLDPIEGVWRFPSDGAVIAIVKDTPTTFDIFIIDSPRGDVKPGTHSGYAVVSPKDNYYDGKLESNMFGAKGKLTSQSVTFTVNPNGSLAIKPYKTGYSLSFRRWISYFLRISVVNNNRRPSDLDGAMRVYPYYLSEHYPVRL